MKWTSQNFPYLDKTNTLKNAVVGKEMNAHLDPKDPLEGNDASSSHQKPFYNSLKAHYNPGTKHWVRGHLLNANLGGPNVPPNLFPITGHANGMHLNYVENHVKDWVIKGHEVDYRVIAERDASSGYKKTVGTNTVDVPGAKSVFACEATRDDKKTITRYIYSTPDKAGDNSGNWSNWMKSTDKDIEDGEFVLGESGALVLEDISKDSDPDVEALIVEKWESGDISNSQMLALLRMCFGDDEDWAEEYEIEIDEEADSTSKVLNEKLKAWLNEKKLNKKQVTEWMKNHFNKAEGAFVRE